MGKDTNFDFELVQDDDKLLKEESPIKKAIPKAKKMGRPKKDDVLRKKQVSTYLSDEEYEQFAQKLAGVPSSVALRGFIIDFVKNH